LRWLHSSLNKKDFCCGKSLLDNYLHIQASQEFKRKHCVVFALFEDTVIEGCYTLSNAGSGQHYA
jgi:hypothetical protein